MELDEGPLDSLLIRERPAIDPWRIVFSAAAGIGSMIVAFLLMVGFTRMEKHSMGIRVALVLLLVTFFLLVPIWMFIRSVFLLNKSVHGGLTKFIGIFLTMVLGCILLLLVMALVFYARSIEQIPG